MTISLQRAREKMKDVLPLKMCSVKTGRKENETIIYSQIRKVKEKNVLQILKATFLSAQPYYSLRYPYNEPKQSYFYDMKLYLNF